LYKYLAFLVIFISAPFGNYTFAIDLNDALEKKHQGQPVISKNWMISAANPYAVEAGAEILENWRISRRCHDSDTNRAWAG
jgi:hypothetical protein